MRKRPSPLTGLSEAADRLGAPDVGRVLGDTLNLAAGLWPAKGRFAIPQPCPIGGPNCGGRTYSDKRALNRHLETHPLGPRARSDLCERAYLDSDGAYRAALRTAMEADGDRR